MVINKNSLVGFCCCSSLVEVSPGQRRAGEAGVWRAHSTLLTSLAISWRGLELAGAVPRDAWCLSNVNSFQIRNQGMELMITLHISLDSQRSAGEVFVPPMHLFCTLLPLFILLKLPVASLTGISQSRLQLVKNYPPDLLPNLTRVLLRAEKLEENKWNDWSKPSEPLTRGG